MSKSDLYLESLFHFEERVVITTGFFKGFKGTITDVYREPKNEELLYKIKLDKNRKEIMLNKDFIRKVWKIFNFEV